MFLSSNAPGDDRWEEWDRFAAETPQAGFMQSSWWAEFRTHYGFDHFGVVLRNRGDIVGGAMVQRFSFDDGACFYYAQEGPVLHADESVARGVFDAVLREVEERCADDRQAVSHFRIEPRWSELPAYAFVRRATPAAPDRFMEPRRTLCVDLRPSEDEILAGMKPKGRYNVRVAHKHGVVVTEDRSERGVADFLAIYLDTASRQGFDAKPPDYFQTLAPFLASRNRGSLYFAEHEGVRVAAAAVVHFGRRATYFYGGSLAAHRSVMAPYLLHFEIMRGAKAAGMDWYDLWGVAPPDEPDHPWRGISELKRKFGGLEVSLAPAVDYVFDRTAYQRYVELEGHEGVFSADVRHPALDRV